MKQRLVPLAAGTDTPVVSRDPGRTYLAIMNSGAGNANLSFGPGAAVVDQGWPLDAASGAGRQGGSMVWGVDEGRGVNADIRAISAVGTTLVVLED